MKKEITIRYHHGGCAAIWRPDRQRDFTGTIDRLVNEVFGYTLECGNSWNRKIPRYPKTAKSLVKALNASAKECRNYSDFYELVG